MTIIDLSLRAQIPCLHKMAANAIAVSNQSAARANSAIVHPHQSYAMTEDRLSLITVGIVFTIIGGASNPF